MISVNPTYSGLNSSLKLAIYVKDGDIVELKSETSDGQIRKNSGLKDVLNCDFSKVHVICPIFVEGTESGDAIKVETIDVHEGWG